MSWTREQVTVLLEEYRKWPNLYKVKSINYKNRNKRREALDSVVNALKHVKPDVSVADIQSKFQALKQNAQRERKKCLESQRSGAGTDEIVEPSLWYFNHIQYIFDENDPRPAVDSLQDVTHREPDEVQEMVDEDSQAEKVNPMRSQEGLLILDIADHSSSPLLSPSTPVLVSPTPSAVAGPSWLHSKPNTPEVAGPKPKKRKLTANTAEDGVLNQVAKSLSSISAAIEQPHLSSVPLQQQGLSTASFNFANYVAAKLDRITDEGLQDEAEQEIVGCLSRALKKCRELQTKL